MIRWILPLFFSISAWAAPIDKANLKEPLPSNLWIEMAKLTRPGVVGVYFEPPKIRQSSRRFRDPMFDFMEEFFGHGFEYEMPGEPQNSSPIGTGFVIRADGLIVTNYHVVEPAIVTRTPNALKVQVNGEKQLHAVDIVGTDKRGDLALLKLKDKVKVTPLEFGDSDKLEVGEYVAAFGNPFGHSDSMTVGIISAKGRAIRELNRFPFLQTDASINPGNSGGPLLNTKGYVIGVNSAIDARAQGIGFAIPSNYVKQIIRDLEEHGYVKRGFLGVQMATLHPMAASRFGLPTSGVLVRQVINNTPADQAGIQKDDVIVEFNKAPVHHVESLTTSIQDAEIGKSYPIKVLRQTPQGPFKEVSLNVVISEYPEAGRANRVRKKIYVGQNAPYDFGFSVSDSSSGARKAFSIPLKTPFGPIINNVRFGSPASRSGLLEGDVLLSINGEEVNNATEAIKALKEGENKLKIARGKERIEVILKND
ncbi:MAG: trypsin-like peptidase domain-containing protein [Bdellovibrionales bacterium]|nr:trypsin-like peptidase domain-containing protein [Bdellovibrionales bacterium]